MKQQEDAAEGSFVLACCVLCGNLIMFLSLFASFVLGLVWFPISFKFQTKNFRSPIDFSRSPECVWLSLLHDIDFHAFACNSVSHQQSLFPENPIEGCVYACCALQTWTAFGSNLTHRSAVQACEVKTKTLLIAGARRTHVHCDKLAFIALLCCPSDGWLDQRTLQEFLANNYTEHAWIVHSIIKLFAYHLLIKRGLAISSQSLFEHDNVTMFGKQFAPFFACGWSVGEKHENDFRMTRRKLLGNFRSVAKSHVVAKRNGQRDGRWKLIFDVLVHNWSRISDSLSSDLDLMRAWDKVRMIN